MSSTASPAAAPARNDLMRPRLLPDGVEPWRGAAPSHPQLRASVGRGEELGVCRSVSGCSSGAWRRSGWWGPAWDGSSPRRPSTRPRRSSWRTPPGSSTSPTCCPGSRTCASTSRPRWRCSPPAAARRR
ncbi:hypothetical protein [Ornithinimicrobium kibberense]|uniref:hypothetical protein n=1 Tax=Ornithinimicrobium kibberense TaxID=282060 RepID=UPI00360EBA1F